MREEGPRVTVSEHDPERLQALELELSEVKAELARFAREKAPVSYTHLTLPTILRV